MAERLATRTRDDEMLTTVMHPTPTHETYRPGAPLTAEEEAALLAMEQHYSDGPPITPPDDPGDSGRGGEPGDPAPRSTALDLVLVDQSQDARDFARDAAEARLTQELNEGGRFKRFVKGIWKGNIAKEYYRQKYIKEAQTNIERDQDVLANVGGVELSARGRAQFATMERFQHDHAEMINGGAGERRNVLEGDSELAVGLKGPIRDFAEGRIGQAALKEEINRFLNVYREVHGTELVGEGRVQISNYVDIALAAKGAIENGESVDNVIGNMRIITGEARTGARTEAQYNKADKAIEWMSKRRITSLLPESVIIGGTAIASGILRIGSVKTIGAIAQTVAPGLGGALIAGLREAKHVKDERKQHSREMAVGQFYTEGDKRREQMEDTRYEAMSAQSMTEALRNHHESIFRDDSERPAGETKDGALQAALDALTAVEVRTAMTDSQKMDLIAYQNIETVGDERMQLALARAQLKVALRRELDNDARTRLNIDDTASIEDLIEGRSQAYIDTIREDVSAKDKAFRSLRRRRVAVAASVGLAAGLTLGIASQEVMAALSDTRAGFVEQAWNAENKPLNGTDHQTIVHGLVHGDKEAGQHVASPEYNSIPTGEHSKIELSADHTVTTNPDGTVNLIDLEGKTTIGNIPVNADGSLPPESIKMLESKGMIVQDTSVTIDKMSEETKEVNFKTFMENHKGDTVDVVRDGWYDNDTPAPDFNLNEQGLQWGGKDGTGITKTGYQLNIKAMTENGSFHGDKSVDWREAVKDGKIEFHVSADKDSQTAPFLVDVDEKGNINIPEDSPAGQFFAKEDGHAVFNGQYGEVSHVVKVDEDGTRHVRPLATIVGTGDAKNGSFTDIVTKHNYEKHPSYKITTGGYETTGTFTEMAPVVPVNSRRTLENAWRETLVPLAERPRTPEEEARYGYGGYEYARRPLLPAVEFSPRLNSDPGARLNPKEELDWYKRQLETKTGRDYALSIEEAINKSPELNNPKPELKAMVTIPVGAVGEADNIYKTISLYAQQDPDAKASTTILLHVNWIDDAMGDPTKAAAIQKTKDEIERARRDFPDLTIATMETEWSRDKINNGEYGDGIIGHVARKMYDVAMMSAQHAIATGAIPPDQDVMLIRNDADAKGMDRRYLSSMIAAGEQHPENDVFTGTIRWDTERHEDLPGFAFVTNFREVMQISLHREGIDEWPQTVGINTAVRMSTFAAVGGIGHDPQNTGAGSDDLSIGARISSAREGRTYGPGASYVGPGYADPSYSRPGGSGKRYDYHRHVVAAGIDSTGDRLEGSYLSDRTITGTWADFDKKGHTDRSAGLASLNRKEDLAGDPADVIARIEKNISSMMSQWYFNPAHYRAALAMMLPVEIGGNPTYTVTRTDSGATFKLSDEGAKWVVNRLGHDSSGNADPIGRRVRRILYHENPDGRTLNTPKPRFVS